MSPFIPALAALALVAGPAIAADLPVKLRDGATWTQTSVHSRTDVRNGATQTATATLVVRVTYRTEGPVATLRQEFVSFDVDGARAEERAQLATQAKLVYPAVVEVDDGLIPMKVRDWDAMRETIFRALGANTPDPRALQAVKETFARLDAEGAAQLFKEQALVGLGQGTALETGKPELYDSEVPNLFGGPPIKASGQFSLESYDAGQRRAVVVWSQTPDPKSMAESLKVSMDALVARAAPDKADAMRAQLAGLTMERQERCRYDIDVPTGLAVKADCTVDIKSGTASQLATRSDHWIITQSLPEPR